MENAAIALLFASYYADECDQFIQCSNYLKQQPSFNEFYNEWQSYEEEKMEIITPEFYAENFKQEASYSELCLTIEKRD